MKDNIFPVNELLLTREERESKFNQKAHVFWITGISGSGKTTLSVNLEKMLWTHNCISIVLDGDQLRSGLNKDLEFSLEDRFENIRRAAEISKFMLRNGIIVICTFISPLQVMRNAAKEIIGSNDFSEIYVKCEVDICKQRDVKGLYKKAAQGKVVNMTSVSQEYEEPIAPDLIIDTGLSSIDDSSKQLFDYVMSKVNSDERKID